MLGMMPHPSDPPLNAGVYVVVQDPVGAYLALMAGSEVDSLADREGLITES
ncbi:MAG: hypothetical protein KatS3mg051_1389 [Anaerolineae bacterium]|nr:MAG: hypothetical protein KatS3mg051_1389 [Anaerolineae bacterium]